MGLPLELLPYAENLYRRFPEEFLALGAPGLEQVFDLRPHGTWSRRLSETPTEKTVEITIRRWQMPTLAPWQALPPAQQPPACPLLGAGGATSTGWCSSGVSIAPQAAYAAAAGLPFTVPGQLGGMAIGGQLGQFQATPAVPAELPFGMPGPPGGQAAGPHQASQPLAPASSAPSLEDQAATLRLLRLEAALSELKPQIEALLAVPAAAAPAPAAPADVAPDGQTEPPRSAPLEGRNFSEPAGGKKQAQAATAVAAGAESQELRTRARQQRRPAEAEAAAPAETRTDSHELRSRRNMVSLQIRTTPPTQEQERVVPPAHPEVLKVNPDADSSEGQASADEPVAPASSGDGGKAREAERQRPRVNAVRVAPSATDPVSPRSPGRYSAWK